MGDRELGNRGGNEMEKILWGGLGIEGGWGLFYYGGGGKVGDILGGMK